ncbi:hypothetical protein DFH28DRAFT_947049, partial [Melampsora americana]
MRFTICFFLSGYESFCLEILFFQKKHFDFLFFHFQFQFFFLNSFFGGVGSSCCNNYIFFVF